MFEKDARPDQLERIIYHLIDLRVAMIAGPLVANGMAPFDAIVVATASWLSAELGNPDPNAEEFKKGTAVECAWRYREAIPAMRQQEAARIAEAKLERERKQAEREEYRRSKRKGLQAVTRIVDEPQEAV